MCNTVYSYLCRRKQPGVVVALWGCGGSVVERQATYPVVPGSNPGQSLQYQKISWVL